MNKLICLFLVLGLSGVAFGLGPEITGVSVIAESPQYDPGTSANEMINGSELNWGGVPGAHGTGYIDAAWLTKTDGSEIGFDTPADAFATLDLGAEYELGTLRVWNYNEYAIVGVATMYLEVSSDNVTYVDSGLGLISLTQAPVDNTYDYSELVDLGGVSARYVNFDVVTVHAYPGGAGMSEVKFYEVPEPATIALLGLGALALIRKRRTQ